MANAINTGDIIAKDALAIIENQLVISKNINREYKKEWDKKLNNLENKLFNLVEVINVRSRYNISRSKIS